MTMQHVTNKKPANPLEKDIERKAAIHAKGNGVPNYKFKSPSQRSVPDRQFLFPLGVTVYIEFKRLGEKPTRAQELIHKRMRATGARVYVCDSHQSYLAVFSMHR